MVIDGQVFTSKAAKVLTYKLVDGRLEFWRLKTIGRQRCVKEVGEQLKVVGIAYLRR